MPTCFVPGCTSGYSSNKNNTDRHFFSAPKDATLRSLWNKAIPRADKELSPDKELFFLGDAHAFLFQIPSARACLECAGQVGAQTR